MFFWIVLSKECTGLNNPMRHPACKLLGMVCWWLLWTRLKDLASVLAWRAMLLMFRQLPYCFLACADWGNVWAFNFFLEVRPLDLRTLICVTLFSYLVVLEKHLSYVYICCDVPPFAATLSVFWWKLLVFQRVLRYVQSCCARSMILKPMRHALNSAPLPHPLWTLIGLDCELSKDSLGFANGSWGEKHSRFHFFSYSAHLLLWCSSVCCFMLALDYFHTLDSISHYSRSFHKFCSPLHILKMPKDSWHF